MLLVFLSQFERARSSTSAPSAWTCLFECGYFDAMTVTEAGLGVGLHFFDDPVISCVDAACRRCTWNVQPLSWNPSSRSASGRPSNMDGRLRRRFAPVNDCSASTSRRPPAAGSRGHQPSGLLPTTLFPSMTSRRRIWATTRWRLRREARVEDTCACSGSMSSSSALRRRRSRAGRETRTTRERIEGPRRLGVVAVPRRDRTCAHLSAPMTTASYPVAISATSHHVVDDRDREPRSGPSARSDRGGACVDARLGTRLLAERVTRNNVEIDAFELRGAHAASAIARVRNGQRIERSRIRAGSPPAPRPIGGWSCVARRAGLQRGGPPSVGAVHPWARRIRGSRHLAPEVAFVQRLAPHRFITGSSPSVNG